MSDDLIKRSGAIEAVWKPQVKPNELIFDALKTAIESEINNVPSADIPTWIPCSDRLPEVNEDVLVTDGCIMHVCSLYDADYDIYGAYHWEDDFYIVFDLKEWDAWMPLPKPYKEKNDE